MPPVPSVFWPRNHLFKHASLNSVKIVARGVMTIDVNSVPPTIDTVVFDNEKDGSTLWTVTPAATEAPEAKDAGKPTARQQPSRLLPAPLLQLPARRH